MVIKIYAGNMGVGLKETENIINSDISKLAEQISALYLNQTFSDIVLNVGGEKLYAHKVILAARSGYFESLLYVDDQEINQSQITINDVSAEAFKMVLKFIYTGTITITSNVDFTLQVLRLAHQYSLNDMKQDMITKFKSTFNIQNICSILNTANFINLDELIKTCHEFLDNQAIEILTNECFNELTQVSVIKLLERDSFFAPEIEIFKAVSRWCEVNNDVDSLVVKCVRLSLLTVVEIVSIVWPSRLVNNETLLNAIAECVDVKPSSSHCRGKLLADKNVATLELQAEVITGENVSFLLNGNRDVSKYAHHKIGSENSITFKLATPTFINHIHMMLWEADNRSYSYYIEVSIDKKKWKKIIDYSHYFCRSYQNLYFEQEIVQYIRLVGTKNTVNTFFHLIFFETYYKTNGIPRTINGIIYPTTNVATIDKKAVVIEGSRPNVLLEGDTKNYDDRNGFSYHKIVSGSIMVQLAQPYIISSMKMLLWDGDDRFYKYYIESSTNKTDWEMVVDRRNEECKSWQIIQFKERPVVFIKITGTHNSANNEFHCVHFECCANEAK